MIRQNTAAEIERARWLLEEHIPDQMRYYRGKCAARKASARLHYVVLTRQLVPWSAAVAKLAAAPTAFLAAHPSWTVAEITGLGTSLGNIAAAIRPAIAGALNPQGAYVPSILRTIGCIAADCQAIATAVGKELA